MLLLLLLLLYLVCLTRSKYLNSNHIRAASAMLEWTDTIGDAKSTV